MHHLKMKIKTHSSRLPDVLTWKLWLKTAVNERRGAKKLFVFFSASEISGDPQNTLGTLVAAIFNFLTRAMRWRAHRIVTRIYRYLLSRLLHFAWPFNQDGCIWSICDAIFSKMSIFSSVLCIFHEFNVSCVSCCG